MSALMVQTITGYFLSKGLQAETVITILRAAHIICVTLFMGTLRGSEILGYDSLKFDPVKTFLGNDVKTLEAESKYCSCGETTEDCTLHPSPNSGAQRDHGLLLPCHTRSN